jgi:CO/xanthine dehydrogenase FAD-binding subunit
MLTAVRAPETLADVISTLVSNPTAILVGGGTTVVPRLTLEATDASEALSLRRLRDGLRRIAVDGDRITVGAMATLADLGRDARLAFLAPVLAAIGSPTLRATATVGGNFFVEEPYGDLAAAMIALDAECAIVGPEGEQRQSAEAVAAHGLPRGAVLTEVAFRLPAPGTFRFRKAARRRLNSASIATVAAVVVEDGGVVASARVALGGVASRPCRSPAAEAALVGRPLDAATADAAGRAALADAEPFTDAYASAWYRARVLPVHVRLALVGA